LTKRGKKRHQRRADQRQDEESFPPGQPAARTSSFRGAPSGLARADPAIQGAEGRALARLWDCPDPKVLGRFSFLIRR
jgi:hypothetical protein